ncbi:MAG: c-type cytochrome, partial [Thermodesulfobacteriota bacterium]
MTPRMIILTLLILSASVSLSYAQVKEAVLTKKAEETAQAVEAGKKLYMKRCSFCHGNQGGGDGPVADYLNPRPRDFKLASYKFRTTESGEFPTDQDLFRIISRGIPGTAMPSWSNLTEEERWQLVSFIKILSEDPWPKDPPPQPLKFGPEIASPPQVIEKGKEVYKKAKCWECHGDSGRGEGPSAPTLKDDLDNFIRPLNLTKSWMYRAGNDARDIFVRFSTGIDTTPMPSYSDSLSEEERWQLAYYVKSLQTQPEPGAEIILQAKRTDGELPLDPNAPVWQRAEPLVIPLAGQVLVKPRWQNPSVDVITLRALFNDKTLAFLIVWDDPFKDNSHQEPTEPSPPETNTNYVKVDLSRGKYEGLRDAVALQFPVTIPPGQARPFFLRGNP